MAKNTADEFFLVPDYSYDFPSIRRGVKERFRKFYEELLSDQRRANVTGEEFDQVGVACMSFFQPLDPSDLDQSDATDTENETDVAGD